MQATRELRSPQAGDRAPESMLASAEGQPIHLASFWTTSANGALVVFLRHFGCLFCREQAKLLRDSYEQFTTRGISVVAIGLGTPEDATGFASWLKLPYPVLGHPEPTIHAEWGLGKASAVTMIRPDLIKSGFRALKTGSVQGKTTGEPKQLPGTFLVDPSGRVRWARPGQHPGDNPSIDEVLAATDALVAAVGR